MHTQLDDPGAHGTTALEDDPAVAAADLDARAAAVRAQLRGVDAAHAEHKRALIVYCSHIGGHKYAGNVIVSVPVLSLPFAATRGPGPSCASRHRTVDSTRYGCGTPSTFWGRPLSVARSPEAFHSSPKLPPRRLTLGEGAKAAAARCSPGRALTDRPPFLPLPSAQINTPRGACIWYGRVTPHEVDAIVRETIVGGRILPALLRGGMNLRQAGNRSLNDW